MNVISNAENQVRDQVKVQMKQLFDQIYNFAKVNQYEIDLSQQINFNNFGI